MIKLSLINTTLIMKFKQYALGLLSKQSKKCTFGIDETESLSTYFICQAFEYRNFPDVQRSLRLSAMIVSRIDVIDTSLMTFINPNLDHNNWLNDDNDIIFEDINSLRKIAGFKIFGDNKNMTLSDFLSSMKIPGHRKEYIIASKIIKLSEL